MATSEKERQVLSDILDVLEPLPQDDRARVLMAVCVMLDIRLPIDSEHFRLAVR